MDHTTQILDGGDPPVFTSAKEADNAVDLLWTRDGREAPGPGAQGDVLPVAEDLFSRTFRGRAPNGEPILVEMQRDVLDEAALPRAWQPFSNDVIDGIWRRRTAARGAEPVSDIPWCGFHPLPPLVVCKEKAALFTPPAPETGRPDALEDCRDDELLESLQLPSWGASITRLLYDANAARTTSRPKFYSAALRPPRDAAVRVGGWDDFVRDLGRLVDPRATVDPSLGTVADRFPCLTCDQANRCFPQPGSAPPGQQGLARQRLSPVAFHPFHAIALRPEVLDFGEHLDLLGGATWKAFRSRHVDDWKLPGRRLAREQLEHTAFARVAAIAPVQALSAKLALFQAVVEKVAKYHRAHGQPHLLLSPDTIVSHSLFVGEDESHDVELRSRLRSALLEDILECPPGAGIWLPPPGAAAPYAHADILRATEPEPVDGGGDDGFRFGWPQSVRVTVGRIWEDEAHGTVQCELNLAGNGLATIGLEPGDLVCVTIDGPGWEEEALWCRADPERALDDIDALPLRSEPTRLTSGNVLDLRSAASSRALFGGATVYRSYGAFYDIHALGMLLLQALLDNSKHGIDHIAKDVFPALVSLSKAARSSGTDAQNWEELVGILESVVEAPPMDVFLRDTNASFFPEEAAAGSGRVPRKLWAELLAIVVSCVTRVRGVGICNSSRLETDTEAFCAPIERLLKRVKTVRRSLPMPQMRDVPAPPPSGPPGAPAAPRGPDPNERIHILEKELRSKVAHIERLESQLGSAIRARDEAERRTPAPAQRTDTGTEQAWHELMDALAGGSHGTYPAPKSGDPALELMKVLLVDAIATLSVLHNATAELGGQEFANEQRDLSRMVRTALTKWARNDPGAADQIQGTITYVRQLRGRLGGVIGLLVEAHGQAARVGTQNMLKTVEFALRKELGLKGSRLRDLEGILARIQANLGELIARLYDPVFQRQIQKGLRGRSQGR